jgi:hypothetical protein
MIPDGLGNSLFNFGTTEKFGFHFIFFSFESLFELLYFVLISFSSELCASFFQVFYPDNRRRHAKLFIVDFG